MAEIDVMRGAAPRAAAAPVPSVVAAPTNKCPHCGATFEKALKFCGECGKPMGASA
jgi:hypothetical protein